MKTVTIPFSEYESLLATIDVLSDPDAMAAIKEARENAARGIKGVPLDAVFGKGFANDSRTRKKCRKAAS